MNSQLKTFTNVATMKSADIFRYSIPFLPFFYVPCLVSLATSKLMADMIHSLNKQTYERTIVQLAGMEVKVK